MDADATEIAVDGDVAAVAHHDRHGAAEAEHGTDLAVENATGLGSGLAADVDALVVEGDILQTFDIVLAKVADNAVGAGDGHGQTAAVALEVTADAHILGGHAQGIVGLLARCGHGTGVLTLVGLGLTLGSATVLLGLTGTALGSLAFLLILGSGGGSLGLTLTLLGLGNATGILAGSGLGSGFLAGQLGGSLLGGLGLGTLLGLGGGTGLLAGYLLSYQAVNLGVQRSVLLLLLGNDVLNLLLLLLQRIHHVLLLGLLALQRAALLFALGQQAALLVLGDVHLLELQVHFLLLGLDGFALHALVGGILAHEAHATEHLHQVVGTEDEHELALRGAVAVHVAHGLDVVPLALIELALQHVELGTKALYLDVEVGDVVTDGVDGTALALNLGVDDHEVLQALAHVFLIGTEQPLLFLDFLLNLLALVLQGLDRRGADSSLAGLLGFAGFTRCSRGTRFTRGTRLTRFFGSGSLLGRRLRRALLRIGSQRQ